MAEIRGEQKRRAPWWLWLALVAVLVALAWWVARPPMQLPPGNAAIDRPSATLGAPPALALDLPPAIAELRGYVGEPPMTLGPSHDYTADGLRKLAAAIDAARPPGGGAAPQSEAIRRYADQLQVDSGSREHARMARSAFLSAAGAIEDIQRRGFPMLADEVADLRRTAEAIDPQQPLLSQTEQTRAFFERSSEVLVHLGPPQG